MSDNYSRSDSPGSQEDREENVTGPALETTRDRKGGIELLAW